MEDQVNEHRKARIQQDPELGDREKAYALQAEQITRSEAYVNPRHPDHLRAVRHARQLFTAAYGGVEEIDAEINRPLSAREKLYSRED